MPNVVIDFTGDASGLKPAFDALVALGKLSKDQQDAFQKALVESNKKMATLATSTTQVIAPVKKLSEGVKEISKTIAGAEIKTGTENFKKLGKEIQDNVTKSTSLKAQLRQLKAELATIDDEGSPQFQKLAVEAAKLEDKIGDVNERIRVLASDTFAFDAVVGGARAAASGFAIVQGSMALFGKESEDVQKALLKVNAAMAILTGLQEAANIVTGQGEFKLGVISAAQSAYTFVVGASTGALKAFRLALAGLGLGGLIFVLYEVANAMGLFGSETKKAAENTDELIKSTKELTDAEHELAVAKLNNIAAISKAQLEADDLSKKSAREIAASERDILESQLANNARKLEENTKTQEDINKRIGSLELTQLEQTGKFYDESLKELVDYDEKLLQENINSAKIRLNEAVNERNRILSNQQALNASLITNEIALAKELVDIDKKTEEKRIADLKDYFDQVNEGVRQSISKNEKIRKANEDIAKELEIIDKGTFDKEMILLNRRVVELRKAGVEEILIAEYVASEATRIAKQSSDFITEERERGIKKIAELRAKIRIEEEKEAAAELEREKERQQAMLSAAQTVADTIFQIQANSAQATFDDAMNKLNQQRDAELNNANLTEGQKNAIREKYRQQEAALKRQEFERNKQAAIIEATIKTALAVINAYTTGDPYTAAIRAALAGVAGAAQIAVIAAQPVPQFAKGTEYVKGPGTGTSDSIHARLSKGERVVPAHINAQLQGIPNDMLPQIARYANMFPEIPESALNQLAVSNSLQIDYDKMGDAFAAKLAKNPHLSVSIDRNGVNVLMSKGNKKTNYLNRKVN